MKHLVNAAALTCAILVPASLVSGQGVFGRAEGARPGETYQAGQPVQPAQPVQPGYGSPQQVQPGQPQGQYMTNQGAPQQEGQSQQATRETSHATGKPVIMEFSDLQCPDSARYNRELKNTILQRYVTSGKVAYEWHDFPLPVHGQAMEAAAAARCAGSSADSVRQQIMANQGQMTPNVFAGYARQAGVNSQAFNECLQSGSSMSKVQADHALGQSLGVRGTPTLVLGTQDANGRVRPVKVVKAYDPPQQVLSEIDSFLASASAPRQQQKR